jgi:hypothetical protein
MSIQYKLKQEKGVLHVGGGRFFYPGETYDLADVEAATYGHYFSEEEAAVVDEELGKKDSDNEKTEDDIVSEMAIDNTEKVADDVETEAKIELQIDPIIEPKVDPAQNRRKPSSEKVEK